MQNSLVIVINHCPFPFNAAIRRSPMNTLLQPAHMERDWLLRDIFQISAGQSGGQEPGGSETARLFRMEHLSSSGPARWPLTRHPFSLLSFSLALFLHTFPPPRLCLLQSFLTSWSPFEGYSSSLFSIRLSLTSLHRDPSHLWTPRVSIVSGAKKTFLFYVCFL